MSKRLDALIGGIDQRVEPAAKAAAGNFFCREAAGAEHRSVHEFAALVIGDKAHAKRLSRKLLREFCDASGFSGAEETANHYIARSC